MEECPICFEPIKKRYKLTNCNHKICVACARQCKSLSEESCVDVKSNFLVHYNNANPIKCPLCRTMESKWTVDEFKIFDPDNYNEWIQLELHCDEWGSSFYYYQEKQKIQKSWIPPNYVRIPKKVSWKFKSFKRHNKI